MDALKRAIDFAYLEGFSKIIIVAKSLGGIIASFYLEQYPDSQIELLILGYIPSEIKQRAISNNLKLVIQGINDRFASPIEVKKNVGSLVEVIEIIDADHSYRNSKKEPIYQETAIKELMKWVKNSFNGCIYKLFSCGDFGIIIRFLECMFSLAIGFFPSRLDSVYKPSFNKTKELMFLFYYKVLRLRFLTWGSY